MFWPLGGQGVYPTWGLTLLSPGMMDCAPLPEPGPATASPSCPGAAHNVIVLHSPRTQQPSSTGTCWGTGGFCGGCCSQLNQRDVVSTPRVWQKWWKIGHLIDSVSAWLGKHENGTSSVSDPITYPMHGGSAVLSHTRSLSLWDFWLFNANCWEKIFLKSQI